MWLKPKEIDRALADSRFTRAEAAKEFEYRLPYINEVFDGRWEADEDLARLLLAAFGAAEMASVIDWRRTAA